MAEISQRRMRRAAQAIITCSLALALAFGVMTPPANAATEIFAHLQVLAFQAPTPVTHEFKVDVHVPMNRQDAEGYLWNGAYIALDFWADDPIDDDELYYGWFYFFRTTPGIYVQDDGLHLSVRIPTDCDVLNEDPFPELGDEVYVEAYFVDGDGHQISTESNVVSGSWGWCAT
jgi:hypothetical protein